MEKIKTWLRERALPFVWNLLIQLTLVGVVIMWTSSTLIRLGWDHPISVTLFDVGYYLATLFVAVVALVASYSVYQGIGQLLRHLCRR